MECPICGREKDEQDMYEVLKRIRRGFDNNMLYYDLHISSDKECCCFFCELVNEIDAILAKAGVKE